MKKWIIVSLLPGVVFAGSPSEELVGVGAAEYWIRPAVDIRARYEFAAIEGMDASHALTFRERIGLQTKDWHGLSAFVEGEFTQAAIDDFHGQAPGVSPSVANNSFIADPETNELNQAFVQYAGFDSVFRIGRQRIIYDNAAMIGNVGWRQNEQTFDAISLSNNSIEALTVQYAYIHRVNRIFGSDATGFAGDLGTNIHALNVSYRGLEGFALGGYVYLMDFDRADNFDNDSYGLTLKTKQLGLDFYGEIAFQNDAGAASNDESWYAHGFVAKTIESQTFTLGVEHLSAGFRTPLATLHAFNGFADVFAGERLNGTGGGLTDLYLSHTIPIFWDLKFTNVLHAFGDNEISTGRGWEFDSVLAKKFDEHFLAIAKLAHFETESALPTTTRVSLELNYSF